MPTFGPQHEEKPGALLLNQSAGCLTNCILLLGRNFPLILQVGPIYFDMPVLETALNSLIHVSIFDFHR
jgi:hypothetical protein